jgi:RsiW-degrading membrane proteinase PrsW (M82 family)
MFRGSDCLEIKTCAGLPLETRHILVGGRFWVSPYLGLKCAVVGPESCHVLVGVMLWGMLLLGVKIGNKLSSKHDMFWCWLAQGFMLLVHQNSHQIASK